MGALTETEIFDCMTANFRLAAQHCDEMAKTPKRGTIYRKLRDELKLIEGAARQASAWRQDTRWLKIGLYMEECHKRAGDWLNKYKAADSQKLLIHLFTKLAAAIRETQVAADRLKLVKTGRIGMILPTPLAAPIRTQDRPFGWVPPPRMSPGGIILNS